MKPFPAAAVTILVAVGLDALACSPAHRATPPAAASHPVPAAPADIAGEPGAPPLPPVDFRGEILPILEARCQPCHFPGGKMYDRLPFDRPETLDLLGTALFSRIRDDDEQALIRAFLDRDTEGRATVLAE